jgi:hypothetical protein
MTDLERTDTLRDRELEFDQLVVNIGSHPDNDAVISGPGVQPFHAMLMPEAGDFRLVTLSPDAYVLVDGSPVQDGVAILTENQRLEIGGFSLLVRRNGTPTSLHLSIAENGAAPVAVIPVGVDHENPILVNVLSRQAEVEVERIAIYQLEIVNAGPIVAAFYVSVQGVPEEWVQVSPRMVNLYESQRSYVQVTITPPRHPSSTAGKHAVDLIVTSPNYPSQRTTTRVDLTILPYYEFSLGSLSPRQQTIHWRKKTGLARLPVTNNGNSPADFSVAAMDEENGCSFDFEVSPDNLLNRQAILPIPAGETYDLPIYIAPHKHPMIALRSRRYHYTTTVQIAEQAVSPQIISGSAIAAPLIGWFTMLLLALLLAAGLFYLLQPRISYFRAAANKDVIELGDSTRLEWAVSPFATRLSISSMDQPITRGQKHITIVPKVSTTYELLAGNWLSGMVGLDQRRTATILVVPPSPRINVFEVDRVRIDKGKPITLRWSVTQADQVFLTIDEVVYELPPDMYSGERPVVLERDAIITLEARSASGSELRSSFVNVVPPNITVNAFTVWVRPKGAARQTPVAAAQVLKLASPAPQDTEFMEQFVTLVEDPAADSGYRVEFLQPDRELDKGEQVLLEWDVEGVDTVNIAPFTETLPARGKQPFFPQESMNFVLTARSGELEKLFMLPVKVFDGQPPQPPKIEFFKATPLKAVGPVDVQFAWSVSGNWTRVQISTEGAVVADFLNPQGFRTVRVLKSTTYILTAWNGDLSSAAPVEITIDPTLIPVDLFVTSVFPETGRFMIGDKVSVTVAFGELPEDKPKPTGQIFVTDGVSTCTITLPALTCDLTFVTPGDPKLITASYAGDTIYLQSDSDPYPGYITVSSATVNLIPNYFFLVKPGNTQGANIPIITNHTFTLDAGVFIRVNVEPVSTILPDDKDGKVTVSVCNQQMSGGQPAIVPGSCIFIGAATVNISDGKGTADIVIANFPGAGSRVLLMEYRHEKNALTPASYTQFGITVARMGIYLSLPTCTDPAAFTGCEIGVSDPADAKIIFDIRRTLDNTTLSTSLPAPENSAFDVFEVDASNNRTKTWSCAVILATDSGRNVYKLECKTSFVGQSTARVNFKFDNKKSVNYFMGANPNVDFSRAPFNLSIKTNTVVSINPLDLLGTKVGQRIVLTSMTGGVLSLTDTNGNPITATIGGFRITASDPAALGVVPGSSCTLNAGVLQITTITSSCSVYFTKTGTFTLNLQYLGDANYYNSSGSVPDVSIARQNGITTTWQYRESATYTEWNITSWEPNKDLPVRILLQGPANFEPASLQSKTLALALTISKNTTPAGTCTVTPIVSSSGTNPRIYQISINSSTGTATVDFTLRCSSEPMELLFNINVADTTNFSIAADQPVEKSLVIAKRPTVGMTINFRRLADNDQTTVAGPPAALKKLFVGEKYTVQITVGVLWADAFDPPYYPGGPLSIQEAINRYLNTPVGISLPSAYQEQVDWTQSTCRSSPSSTELKVLLNAYNVVQSYGYDPSGTGIHDIQIYNSTPCILVFKPTVVTTTGPATFSFTAKNPTYPWFPDYSASLTYNTQGLAKQKVTHQMQPALVTVGQINAPQQNVVMTVIPEVNGSTLPRLSTTNPFLDQISYSAPLGCTGLNLTGTITSTATAALQFTPPSVPCTGKLTIQYNGFTNWYELTQFEYDLDYKNPPGTTTTLTGPATSTFGQSVTFTAEVVVVSPGTGTPTGTVQFKDNGSNLGAPVSLVNGKASYQTGSLSVGAHSLTAEYIPSSNNLGSSQSNTLTHTVAAAGTETVVVSSKNPSALGESVTFTATVTVKAPGSGIPNGAVQFKNGTANLGAPIPLGTDGKAAFTTAALPQGTHTITGVYEPPQNGSYTTSTSSALTQTVNFLTSTSLSSNQNTTVFGESVTFTATVIVQSPGTGIPTGKVQFKDGAANLGSQVNLDSSGVARLTVTSLTIGPHTISAIYIQDPGYTTSTSPNLAHTVTKANTVTTFTLNPANPTGAFTFSAEVTAAAPGAGTPTGTVQLCSSVTGSTCTNQLGTLTLTNGKGTSGTILLLPGTYSDVAAVYSGDNNFNGSVSSKTQLNITAKLNSTLGVLQYDKDKNGNWVDSFPFNTSGNKASANVDYWFRTSVTNASSFVNPPTPTGQVEVWLVDNSSPPQTLPVTTRYTITALTGGGEVEQPSGTDVYRIKLNASGIALFNVKFTQATGGNESVSFRFKYLGDDIYNSSPSTYNQTVEFKIN